MTEPVAVITKVDANQWEVTTPNSTAMFHRLADGKVYELGSTYGWNSLNEAVRYLQASEREATEAHGFKRGDHVLTADGTKCEILAFQASGNIVWLHVVGADASRTMGHVTDALRPAK